MWQRFHPEPLPEALPEAFRKKLCRTLLRPALLWTRSFESCAPDLGLLEGRSAAAGLGHGSTGFRLAQNAFKTFNEAPPLQTASARYCSLSQWNS